MALTDTEIDKFDCPGFAALGLSTPSPREYAAVLRKHWAAKSEALIDEATAPLLARIAALQKALAASCDDEREQLWEATPGGGCSRALDAERRLEELTAQVEQAAQPVAWATFDGEGGYDYRTYDENENYRDEYIKRNGPKFATWVVPLYAHPQEREAPHVQQPVAVVAARYNQDTECNEVDGKANAICWLTASGDNELHIPVGAKLYAAPPKAVPLTSHQTIRTNSQIEHELEAMKRYIKQITKDKSSAVAFLSRAGIIDGNGELAEQYRAVEQARGITPAKVEKEGD